MEWCVNIPICEWTYIEWMCSCGTEVFGKENKYADFIALVKATCLLYLRGNSFPMHLYSSVNVAKGTWESLFLVWLCILVHKYCMFSVIISPSQDFLVYKRFIFCSQVMRSYLTQITTNLLKCSIDEWCQHLMIIDANWLINPLHKTLK